jgi:hypothetical protein
VSGVVVEDDEIGGKEEEGAGWSGTVELHDY